MGVWSKLFGEKSQSGPDGASSLTAPSLGQPSRVVAVAGKLSIAFHAHAAVEGAQGNFLSAVTEGLAKFGQREIVLTLRLGTGDDALARMQEISRFFKTVYGWARQRQFVDAGGVTQFGERALFGRSRSGLLYADARKIEDIELPARALAAIAADEREVQAALDYGAYRVQSRIGEQYRHFPFPSWSDLDRPSVASARENESGLAQMLRTRAPGVSFVVDDERVRVTLSPNVRALLGRGVAAVPRGAPFALLTKPASNASSWLVWHPGQTEPLSIAPDGSDNSRVSGSCLVIHPNAKLNEGRAFEDGYALFLSEESWANLALALRQERELSIRMEEGIRLELGWVPNESSGPAA
jgi:hypothetical protein